MMTFGRFAMNVRDSHRCFIVRADENKPTWTFMRVSVNQFGLSRSDVMVGNTLGFQKKTIRSRCQFCTAREQQCQCPETFWYRSEVERKYSYSSWNHWLQKCSESNRSVTTVMDRITSSIRVGPLQDLSRTSEFSFDGSPNMARARAKVSEGLHLFSPRANIYRSLARTSGPPKQLEGPSKQNYACSYCLAIFTQRNNLRRHQSELHSTDSRLFSCSVCGKAFRQKSNLERHQMMVHLKLKPFACNLCSLSFGTKSNLDRHLRLVH